MRPIAKCTRRGSMNILRAPYSCDYIGPLGCLADARNCPFETNSDAIYYENERRMFIS